MTYMPKRKKLKVIATKRNKYLEPMFAGNRFVIGYDEEIHEKDAVEFSYKLPLGAIERLIRSYWEDIYDYDSEWVYLLQVGSSGMRLNAYAHRMLTDIKKQLNRHGLEGGKIVQEIFDRYFKEKYEKMKRYHKNHSEQDPQSFKPCNDPVCCNYSGSFLLKLKLFWKLVEQIPKVASLIFRVNSHPEDINVDISFRTKT